VIVHSPCYVFLTIKVIRHNLPMQNG
jgi:hypothetical protein